MKESKETVIYCKQSTEWLLLKCAWWLGNSQGYALLCFVSIIKSIKLIKQTMPCKKKLTEDIQFYNYFWLITNQLLSYAMLTLFFLRSYSHLRSLGLESVLCRVLLAVNFWKTSLDYIPFLKIIRPPLRTRNTKYSWHKFWKLCT